MDKSVRRIDKSSITLNNKKEILDEYFVSSGNKIDYYCDEQRHLVCVPYSKENLHLMAEDLNIKRCWFHKDHYDIPKKRIEEISAKCTIISDKEIVNIIRN